MQKKRISNPFLLLLCIIFKFILFLYGIALVTVGFHIILDHGLMLEVTYGSIYLTGTYILIFCGIIMIFSVLIGIVGILKHDRFLLIAYIVLLIILLLFTFIGSILLLAFPSTMNDEAKSNMNRTLQDQYGRNRMYTDAWNMIQTRLRCCAIDDGSWDLYRNSYWDKLTNVDLNDRDNRISQYNPYYQFVPTSCCWMLVDPQTGWPSSQMRNQAQCQHWQFGPPNQKNGPHNDAIYYRGCVKAMQSFLGMYSRGVGVFSLIFLLFIVVSAILTVIQLRKTTRKYKEEKQRSDNQEEIPPVGYVTEKEGFNPNGYRDDDDDDEGVEDEVGDMDGSVEVASSNNRSNNRYRN